MAESSADSIEYGEDNFESGSNSSRSASRSASLSPPPRVNARPSSASSRPRSSRPSDTTKTSGRRRQSGGGVKDDAEYYDDANTKDGADGLDVRDDTNANNDLRNTPSLSSTQLSKLRPSDVSNLRGLTGEAWNRKLNELVSTVKGEAYSRAPAHASLLIDSTGHNVLGGKRINHIDSSSFGATSGSHLSGNPPPHTSAAKRAQQEEMKSNAELFHIAKTSDGAVYGAKHYGRNPKPKIEQKDKVLDKFAMDAEEMKHEIKRLKLIQAGLKSDLHTFHRECDLLDAHLAAQNNALDDAALKKGFLRTGPPEKPRYEKVVSSAGSGASSAKMSLEENYLTLQVQNKSLKSQKSKLEREYSDLQDELGSLHPYYEQEQELERSTRQRILHELHELQESMHQAKARHDKEQSAQDARIHELRHEAGRIQAELDVTRKQLTETTLAYQAQADQKTAMQAKLTAIKKRLARHGGA